MKFELDYSKSSKKFLRKSEKELLLRIFNKLEKLKENPVPSDAKRIEGSKELTFRIRIGKYRILYEVNNNKKVVLVSKIDNREKVY
ncbi:MAG: type II toxin-antitoxin system RelE/ParE family toxin [Nanoarchaeota archaeon]